MANLMRGDSDTASERRRLPSVRLPPRDELAGLARVAPLLRAARDLGQWAEQLVGVTVATGDGLDPAVVAAAASALDLAPREVRAAWRVVMASAQLGGQGTQAPALAAVLAHGDAEVVLKVWDAALTAMLDSEELDGIATALYTVGGPVGMDGLFDAYASAAGTRQARPAQSQPVPALPANPESSQPAHPRMLHVQPDAARPSLVDVMHSDGRAGSDQGAALSLALETLADLGTVELGTEDGDGSLTVALSPLGTWGMHRRLRAQGWHVPVRGAASEDCAQALLAALANCDAEDGEAEITAWLESRDPIRAAAELIDAAADGSPGQRGAAFAVLDRIGLPALDQVRNALDRPLLRAHAAVWLIEHGQEVRLDPADRTWLLVDLGAGLLEEANATDVVAELLPDLPPQDQAEIVAKLWQVSHPGVTSFLTALSDHHPVPAVARAARKAAFKARSPAAATD
jgi:hypothetical protein